MNAFEKAKNFIYKNARPLDLARWQFHFENGSGEAVLEALSHYQNADGGFGHALEPDIWNPNSMPIATWAATEYIREIGLEDVNHPVVQGILRYLDSGLDFDSEQEQWLDVIPSINDHPHAIWWECSESGSELKYNPTASLAGFIIRYADRLSGLYAKGVKIAKRALAFLAETVPFGDQHITTCFINLYEDCLHAKVDFIDMQKFQALLIRQVNHCICKDSERWFTEYLTKPSDFIKSKDSVFYPVNEELVKRECNLILENQQSDGGFPVTWNWWTSYPEFQVAANWWRSYFTIQNMRFLKAFEIL